MPDCTSSTTRRGGDESQASSACSPVSACVPRSRLWRGARRETHGNPRRRRRSSLSAPPQPVSSALPDLPTCPRTSADGCKHEPPAFTVCGSADRLLSRSHAPRRFKSSNSRESGRRTTRRRRTQVAGGPGGPRHRSDRVPADVGRSPYRREGGMHAALDGSLRDPGDQPGGGALGSRPAGHDRPDDADADSARRRAGRVRRDGLERDLRRGQRRRRPVHRRHRHRRLRRRSRPGLRQHRERRRAQRRRRHHDQQRHGGRCEPRRPGRLLHDVRRVRARVRLRSERVDGVVPVRVHVRRVQRVSSTPTSTTCSLLRQRRELRARARHQRPGRDQHDQRRQPVRATRIRTMRCSRNNDLDERRRPSTRRWTG